MAEIIVKVMDYLDRYEVLTQLVAGMFLYFVLEKCSHVPMPELGTVETVVCCWLLGLVSGRLGALVVEPITKWLGLHSKWMGPVFVSRETYSIFRKSNETWCKTLLTDANLYRTLFAGGILVVIARFMTAIQGNVTEWTNRDSILVAWCVLFYASYWRQICMFKKNAEETVEKK